jgi:hypothetical protein
MWNCLSPLCRVLPLRNFGIWLVPYSPIPLQSVDPHAPNSDNISLRKCNICKLGVTAAAFVIHYCLRSSVLGGLIGCYIRLARQSIDASRCLLDCKQYSYTIFSLGFAFRRNSRTRSKASKTSIGKKKRELSWSGE